jgi:hypothetical protein
MAKANTRWGDNLGGGVDTLVLTGLLVLLLGF